MAEELGTTLGEQAVALQQRRKFIRYGFITFCVLFVAGISLLAATRLRTANPLGKAIVAQATFPVFYPQPLPGSYQLKPGSPKYNDNGVVHYILISQDNKVLNISEQARPSDLNPDTLLNAREVNTNYGKAKVVTSQAETTALLFADKTIIYVRAANPVAQADIDQMLVAMRPLHR